MTKNTDTVSFLASTDGGSVEYALLAELSHDLVNARQGFPGRTTRTFVLGSWASSLFGLSCNDEAAILGVPEYIFSLFRKMRLYCTHTVPGQGGLYLIFHLGESPGAPVALRIAMRKARVDVVRDMESIILTPINSDGVCELGLETNEIWLPNTIVDSLAWEEKPKESKRTAF